MKIFKKIRENRKTFLLMSLTLLVLLSFGVLYTLLQRDEVEAGWWDETWMYRKEIQITNSNGSDLDDFQVSFVIDTASLITSGKMESTCNDLRVTDRSGNILPHWIEENNPGCNSASTRVWVKVPSVYQGTNATTIYVYYGNSSANNIENGDNVFEFFDDFNGTEIDNHKWPTQSLGSYITQTGGELKMTGVKGGDYYIQSNPYSETDLPMIIEVRTQTPTVSTNGWSPVLWWQSTTQGASILEHSGTEGGRQYTRNNGTWSSMGDSKPLAEFHKNSIILSSTTGWTGESTYEITSSADWSATYSNTFSGTYYIKIGPRHDESDYGLQAMDGRVDFIMVREYVASEPTTNTSSTEEVTPAPIAYWKFDEGTGVVAHDTSGQGNDGTIYGGSWKTDGSCVSGSCLEFDKTSTNTDNVTTNSSLPSFSEKISLFLWFKTTPQPTDNSDYKVLVIYQGTSGFNLTTLYQSYGYDVTVDTTAISLAAVEGYDPDIVVCDKYAWGCNYSLLNDLYNAGYNIISQGNDTTSTILPITSATHTTTPAGTIVTDEKHPISEGWTSTGNSGSDGRYEIFGIHDSAISIAKDQTNNSIQVIYMEEANKGRWVHLQPIASPETTLFENATEFLLRQNLIGKGKDSNLYTHKGTLYGWVNDKVVSSQFDYNSWNNVGLTYDYSKGTLSLYLNGSSSDSVSYSSILETDILKDLILASSLNGSIDEVKIYPYARTEDEIKSDYATGLSGIGSTLGASTTFGSYSPKWMSDGLVGYWKMDESSWAGVADEVIDHSGNSNHGTSYSGATTDTGKFGNGGSFDGSADGVDIPAFDTPTDSISISAWLKPSTITGDNRQWLVKDSGGGGFRSYLDNSSHKISWKIAGSEMWSDTTLSTDTWYFVTFTFDPNTDKQIMYINGEEDNSSTNTSSITNDGNALSIGYDWADNYDWYAGSIDEVRIYNRALSPTEVKDLYKWAPGPIAHYTFDSGNNTTLNDISGYGNTGTWNGTTTERYAKGKLGKGGVFNGSDDYVNVPVSESSILNIRGNQITQSAWIYPTANVSNGTIATRNGGYYFQRHSDAKVAAYQYGTNPAGYHYSTGTVPLNEWSFVAYSYDGEYITFYINGSPSGRIAKTGDITQISSYLDEPFRIGWDSSTGGRYFNGIIDDVRIYNYARTQSQIVEDMVATGGPPTPIGYWKFDEGSGSIATDSSGNSNDGTITGASWISSGNCVSGKCLYFDGTSKVFVPSSNNLGTGSDGAISFWTYVEEGSPGQGAFIYRSAAPLIYRSIDPRFSVYWAGATNDYPGGVSFDFDNWYHLTLTWEDSDTIKWYINGRLEKTVSSAGLTTSSSSSITMGEYTNGNLKGYLDEVKIFNTFLTPEQVLNEYNKGKTAVLGTSSPSIGNIWGGSASSEYCIPGDTSTCNPPVGEWLFDENQGSTAKDTSGNGNDGTLVNSPSWSKGKEGSALSFDGGNQYVDGGNIGDISNSFSVSMYINPTSFSSTSFPLDYQYGSDADSLTLRLQISTSGIISLGSYIPSVGTNVNANSSTTLQTGNWYKIDGTFDGTTLRIYINGILETEVDTGGTPIYSVNNKIGIGTRFVPGPNLHFPGLIDQVRIYDYARTPSQIAWDYNRGAPVGHWRLDECQGNIAHDISTNENHGTINIGSIGTQTNTGTCTSGNTTDAWYNGRDGMFESSLNFDGSDDYVDAGNKPEFHMGLGDLTFSGWAKFPTNIPDNHGNIVGKGSWNSALGYGLYNNSSSVRGYLTRTDYTDRITTNSYSFAHNTWNHYAVTYKRGATMNFYVNGVLFDSKDITAYDSENFTNSTSLILGKYDGWYCNGQIDDVRIYNYPLTEKQIQLLYNNNSAVRF